MLTNSHLARGQRLLELRRPNDAVDALLVALAEEPHNALVHILLADAFVRLERLDEAKQSATEAVRLAPDAARSHFIRAKVFQAEKQIGSALESLNEAIRLDPNDADYYGLRASLHVQREAWGNVRFSSERGLELDPENCLCINTLALASFYTDDVNRARQLLAQALELDPESILTLGNLGWQSTASGDFETAERWFREALRLDPTWKVARDGLGIALLGQKLIYRYLIRFVFRLERRKNDRRRNNAFAATGGILFGMLPLFSSGLAGKSLSIWFLIIATAPMPIVFLCGFAFRIYHLVFPLPRESASKMPFTHWTVVRGVVLAAYLWLMNLAILEESVRYAFGLVVLTMQVIFASCLLRLPRKYSLPWLLAFLLMTTGGVYATFPSLSDTHTATMLGIFYMVVVVWMLPFVRVPDGHKQRRLSEVQ